MGNFRVLFSSKLEQYAAVVRWNPGSVRHLRHTGAQRLTYTSIGINCVFFSKSSYNFLEHR